MTLAATGDPVEVSVLVPAKDEAENLPEFLRQCSEALVPAPFSFEVVVIDDGSEDESPKILEQLTAQYEFLKIVTHRARRGIAEALRSGGEASGGRILVFYPADLQFLPSEIPSLVEPIRTGGSDLVTGTKQGLYEKAFVSRIYNALCRWLFGVRVTDLNAVKAYRREIMEVVPWRPDWHRYMVVIAAAEGFRLEERPVTLHPRRAGQSKFGLGRIPVGMMDLLSVWFQLRFGRKPLLFFGLSGGILFALGFLVGVAALILRFGYGIGLRPLLNLVIMLVITGVALFGFGFVGEMLAGAREDLRGLGRSLEELHSELRRREP